jgi:AraC family transcriptional activator of pobA
MTGLAPIKIKTISQLHELRGLPRPQHPLISLIDLQDIKLPAEPVKETAILDFYSISVKQGINLKYKYGQQQYDFNEGVMFFTAPGQIIGVEADKEAKHAGWVLFIHPDFLWNTGLGKSIKQYDFFDYAVHEALFLSEKEEKTLNDVIRLIKQEYSSNIDNFSQDIIVSHIEVLLNYADRFHHRQFLTRQVTNHQILTKLEQWLDNYFADDKQIIEGLPSVQEIAAALNISPNYLGGMLKALTGLSTQQHIHEKLIEKAKEKLSSSNLSVSEVAYQLGFEHPQSFSKLFKAKTNKSPLEFRNSFN